MDREHNWSDIYTFAARRFHRPTSIDAARRVVAQATRIRAIGTRHSFNGIADSDELIDLCHLPPAIVVDPQAMTATVSANTSYGVLANELHARGYALHNMGSLPHISVAGAVATGTHGSGDRNGTLSSAVAGLTIILASGDLVSVARGDDGFDGMVVGLGAFGVVTHVTLDIQPTFMVRQDAFVGLAWATLLENFDAVSSAAYSVSLMTKWSGATVDRLWLKTRLTDAVPIALSMAHLGAKAGPASLMSNDEDDALGRLNPFGGVPGPWSERLPHFRLDRPPGTDEQIQSEYMVPRGQAVAALASLREIAGEIDALLLATEIRTMAADRLWLSPSYGQDAVAIHFTWLKRPGEVEAITREVERRLLPLGGRPHWGKLIHASARDLGPLYPRLPEFCALANDRDPGGKFRNTYLARHVFG